MKRVELLAPAGNLEKLEIAVHYGADAVYLGGKEFSLRSFSDNFTIDELETAVSFAHDRGVKVYVACNVYSRNEETKRLTDYLEKLGGIGPDAVIISDPGVFRLTRHVLPETPVHLSTQANVTNIDAVRFWETLGVRRINVARELSLKEIAEITNPCDIEIEAFVHGAMCIAYSGRCLLSSFMAQRESNRGMCCHPCRWRYAVVEETRPGRFFPIAEDDKGSYLFNSRDLCMVDHIPEMIASGVSALKIEGRMKGINYVASAVKVYREAIDAYYEHPGAYSVCKRWIAELSRIGDRGYCTGFYFNEPDQLLPNYDHHRHASGVTFVGKVIGGTHPNIVHVDVRNKFYVGDVVEILTRKGPPRKDRVLKILDPNNTSVTFAKPGSVVAVTLASPCSKNDLLRTRHDP
jgi:U32 family peptidase